MKLLFFDMEFANGKVPGSIYSFGYLMTNEDFSLLLPPEDILINPECAWNDYVQKNILAYPIEEVEAAPAFPAVYERIKALFDEADVAVGFSVANDNRALTKDCARYGLAPILYSFFDTERLCRLQEEHKEAHGLGGYYTAWCQKAPENAHRSDGDAVMTMELLRAICLRHHVSADMMREAYPEACGKSNDTRAKKAPEKAESGKRRRRRRPKRKTALNKADPQSNDTPSV
jgi:DNA polymerase III epsilon subunit-like protein